MPHTVPTTGFRTFTVVWATQSLAQLGGMVAFFALTLWLTTVAYADPAQKAQLAWSLAALNIAYAVPTVLTAPFSGSWVDRHDRRQTVIAANVLSAAAALLLVGLALTHALSLPLLLVGIVLPAVADSFHLAAFDISYVLLVPEHQLPRANAMMQSVYSLVGVLAPGLAAVLLSLPRLAQEGRLPGLTALAGLDTGLVLTLGLQAITFVIMALVLLLV